jgi:transposase
MPPKVRLSPHLSLEELKTRYRQATEPVEARRWHLLMLIAQDWTIKQAAEIMGFNYDYAKEIIRRYNQGGPQTIAKRNTKPLCSPRSLLTLEQQQELQKVLQGPPPDGGEWSGPKVARWIAEKTGRAHVWSQRGWDYLKRLQQKEEGD